MARLTRVSLPQGSSPAQQGGEISPANGGQLGMAVRGKSYLSWLGDQLAPFEVGRVGELYLFLMEKVLFL